jgi:GGDEF domain-containing protein
MALSDRTRAFLDLEGDLTPPDEEAPDELEGLSPSTRDLLGAPGRRRRAPTPPPESLISRAAKAGLRGLETIGHVVGTPARGLGMLATAAQESLAAPGAEIGAAPGSRFRVTPTGEVEAPSLADLSLEGLGGLTGAREVDVRAGPSALTPIEEDPVYQAARRTRGMAVAEPIAHAAISFVTDPALGAFGAAGELAAAGKLTKAGLTAGAMVPDAALAAAAQRAVLAGQVAGAAEKGIGLSFLPGMVEGAYRGYQGFRKAGAEKGYTSPEALRAATEAGINTAMATMIGAGTFGGHGLPAETSIAEAAARARDVQAAEAARGAAETTALEGREREFLTPDAEAAANAEQARLAREYRGRIPAAVRATLTGEAEPRLVSPEGFVPTMRGPGAEMVRLSPEAEAAAGAVTPPGVARTIEQAALRARMEQGMPAEPIQEAPGGPPAPPEAQAPVEAPPLEPPPPVAPEAAPQAPPALENLGQMGKGIVDALYDSVWKRLQAGKRASPFERNPPAEEAAQQAFARGEIKSVEDVRRVMQAAPVGVPFMVTRQMRQQLGERGYTPEQVDKLTPAEAHDILRNPPTAPPGPQPEPAPSPAQMEAGNYPKGHRKWAGLDLSIETPKGGERVAKDGSWRVPDFPADYGYIRRTEGKDGDQVDIFMGDQPGSSRVWVVDQIDPETGKFDEHKALLGFPDEKTALDTYRSAYTDGRAPERIGAVTPMTVEEFKTWARSGDTKKPLTYKATAPAARPAWLEHNVQAAVSALTPEARSQIGAMAAEGKTAKEIAAALGTTAQDVRLARAGLGIPSRTIEGPMGAGSTPNPDFEIWQRKYRRENAPPPAVMETPPAERRAALQEGPRQRRVDLEQRKRVAEMGPEEMRRALLTDELTGLGNRRAWEEAPHFPHVGKLDAEGLKWINDHLGSVHGDSLLKAIGQAMREEGLQGFRVGGDEFLFGADSAEHAARATAAINARLKEAIFRATLPDGTVREYKGARVHGGSGRTLDEADTALNAAKKAAVAGGERAARGERPGGMVEVPAPGHEAERPPAAEEVAPQEKKPVTPQLEEVPGGGTKYTLPSFVTEPFKKPAGERTEGDAKRAAAEASRRKAEDERARNRDTLSQEYKGLKTALTRALNTKDPRKILAEANRGLDRFEELGTSPDDWSRWERAKNDAEFALQREGEGGFKAPELPRPYDVGKAAFAAGKKRIAPTDVVLRHEADAWYQGWDAANLAAPVPEAAPKATTTTPARDVTVSFKAKPSIEVRNRLKGAGFRWDKARSLWTARQSETASHVARVMENQKGATVTGALGERAGGLPEGFRVEEPPGKTAETAEVEDLQNRLDVAIEAGSIEGIRRHGEALMRLGVMTTKDLGDLIETAQVTKGGMPEGFHIEEPLTGATIKGGATPEKGVPSPVEAPRERPAAAEPEPEPQRPPVEGGDRPVRSENQGALAEVPPEDVQGAPAEGEAGSGGVRGPGAHARPAGEPRAPGPTAATGGGEGAGVSGVLPASGRGRPAQPQLRARDADRTPDAGDYRIKEADAIGSGSPREKARANVEALRLLKKIEGEGRLATPAEQAVLVRYSGWGQMPQPFHPEKEAVPKEWTGVRAELESVLAPHEFESARASTPNAHYTSVPVIEGMWRALRRLGLQPGSIALEPAMGAGHFFGLMPEDLVAGARRTGIELDSVTGRIAKLLYPQSQVEVAGFEAVKLPDNFYDVAVSNVPFGNYGIHDPRYKGSPALLRSIHDYFFAKAVDKVRPGGVVAFITSHHTMDKADSTVRRYLAEKTDLLGAVRLPNTAFKANAGTEVTTDILFLQKRTPGIPRAGESWTQLREIQGRDGRAIAVNEYYQRHPEMMLGEMSHEGTMRGPAQPALMGEFSPERLEEALDRLPEGAIKPYATQAEGASQVIIPAAEVPRAGEVKQGGYAIKDGQVVVRRGDAFLPANATKIGTERVKGMLGIRDALREVFRTQIEDKPEAEMAKARKALNSAYDAYVKKHGFLWSRENRRQFDEDPDAPLLLSLEKYSPETKTSTKADVFSKRTIERYQPIERADKASEALTITLNERGRIDWMRMQELTGRTPKEMQEELGDLTFQDPEGRA